MDNKKYYWLKLKDNFFNQLEIKKLRKIAGGDTYTIIYLKLQLLSLKHEGTIFYEGIEDNIIAEIALQIDEEVDNVKITFMYLQNHGLIDQIENDEYLLTKMVESIGKESDSAQRVRKYRENLPTNGTKTLQCNSDVTTSNAKVTKCNTEKEIEIEKEIEKYTDKREKKIKYSESVYLSKDEYMKLMDKYETEQRLNQGIEILNNYLMTNGKKYKSHYHVLIGWVHERVIQDVSKHERDRHEVNTRKNTGNEGSQFTFRQKDYL
jgi:predicted phage replisome organizer